MYLKIPSSGYFQKKISLKEGIFVLLTYCLQIEEYHFFGLKRMVFLFTE